VTGRGRRRIRCGFTTIAIEQLSLAGAQAGCLNSVAADKAVRDQRKSEAPARRRGGNQLSLNRDVYWRCRRSILKVRVRRRQHYVQRTLLSYRLAGVDKDDATRAHLHQLHEKATKLSLEFSRNVQEGARQFWLRMLRNWTAACGLSGTAYSQLRRTLCNQHRSAGYAAGNDLCQERRTAGTDVSGV